LKSRNSMKAEGNDGKQKNEAEHFFHNLLPLQLKR